MSLYMIFCVQRRLALMRHSEFGTSLDHHQQERKICGDSLNHWLHQLSASSHVEKERIKMLVLTQQKSAEGP